MHTNYMARRYDLSQKRQSAGMAIAAQTSFGRHLETPYGSSVLSTVEEDGGFTLYPEVFQKSPSPPKEILNPNLVTVTTGPCITACYTEVCSRNLFKLFVVLVLLGTGLFPLFYLTIFSSFLEAFSFKEGNCTVLAAWYTGTSHTCSCGSHTCRYVYSNKGILSSLGVYPSV